MVRSGDHDPGSDRRDGRTAARDHATALAIVLQKGSGGERVPVIDGLRGFAILMVVFYHFFEKTHYVIDTNVFGWHVDARAFIQAGYLGVELFFFVSGFCLMLPYAAWLAGHREKQSWAEYASRRFWKIVPSYYLALAVVAFVTPLPSHMDSRLTDITLHALFLHAFVGPSFFGLNGNFWSLAIEVEFYVVFPLLVWGFARSPVIAAVVATLIGLTYANWVAATGQDGQIFMDYQLGSFLPLFAIGALCAWVHQRWIRGASIPRTVQIECGVVAAACVGLLGYLCEQANHSGGGPGTWGWQNAHRLEIAMILAVFVLTATCATPFFQRCVGNPVLWFFSDISYNVYLWNATIIDWLGDHVYKWDWLRQLGIPIVGLALSIAVGWVLTHAFERPLMRARLDPILRLFRRRPPSTTTAP